MTTLYLAYRDAVTASILVAVPAHLGAHDAEQRAREIAAGRMNWRERHRIRRHAARWPAGVGQDLFRDGPLFPQSA